MTAKEGNHVSLTLFEMLTMRVCQLAVLTETEHNLCIDNALGVLLVPCTAKKNLRKGTNTETKVPI